MQEIAIIERYRQTRYLLFRWRYSLALANKIALAFGMACVTGLLAQFCIPLPFTPVPVTGQTFAVLLAGVLLGSWWGGISQLLYVGLGAIGIPWFAAWSGGWTVLSGPTGGYFIGFVLAALFLGHFVDKYIRARSFLSMLGLMLFANFILLHIPGLFQLGLWYHLVKGSVPPLRQLLFLGTAPFVIGDLLKIVAAATLANLITPKKSFASPFGRSPIGR